MRFWLLRFQADATDARVVLSLATSQVEVDAAEPSGSRLSAGDNCCLYMDCSTHLLGSILLLLHVGCRLVHQSLQLLDQLQSLLVRQKCL